MINSLKVGVHLRKPDEKNDLGDSLTIAIRATRQYHPSLYLKVLHLCSP